MSNKKIIKRGNLIYLILFLIFLSFFFLYTMYEIEFFSILKKYIFDLSYRNEWIEKLGVNNYFINIFKIIFSLINQNGFDYIIIWGTNFIQIFMPFICILSIFIYYKKNKFIIIKDVLINSLKLSLSLFFAFFVFYLFILMLSKGQLNTYITGELFLDIFGRNFYNDYTYIYYLLEGSIKFFAVPFIYSASSILISKFFHKKIDLYYLIILFYFGISSLMAVLEHTFSINFLYLNPTAIMVSNIYPNINTLGILIFNFSILCISLILFKKINKKIELNFNKIIISTILILLSNFLLIFNYNNEIQYLTAYINISYFIIYSSSVFYFIMNKINDVKYDYTYLLKRIIFISLIFSIIHFIVLSISMIIMQCNFEILKLLYSFVNLFLLLIVINIYNFFFNLIFNKNYQFLNYLIFLILTIIYSINYLYNNHLLFINLFDIYINGTSFYQMIFHYLMWGIIPVIIILDINDSKKRGENKNDRIKRYL